MNISHSVPATVQSLSFSFLSAEDLRRISVKQIVNPILLDDLNRPNAGGLYDPALGPTEKHDLCATCGLNYFTCPGHFGHIELPSPVYHPLFMKQAYNLLRSTCMYCHHFKVGRKIVVKYLAKLRLLERGLLGESQSLDDLQMKAGQKEGEDAEETFENFEKRVNLYVMVHLMRAAERGRDNYKDTVVYKARKDLMDQFFKDVNTKKCRNCGAHGYTFRKEGHTKIIEYDLSDKNKAQNEGAGFRRRNVLHVQAEDDEDVEMSYGDMHKTAEGDNLPRASNGKVKSSRGRNERVVVPEEVRAHLRILFQKESDICSILFGRHGRVITRNGESWKDVSADIFFMEVLPVSPTRFRPPAKLGETMFEHPQNELLNKVLNTSYRVRDINMELKGGASKDARDATWSVDHTKLLSSLMDAIIQIQIDVNSFIDSGKNPAPVRQGMLPPSGVKQVLEKKEGLFRKNMMGKRVNYAARSVISPDVNIEPSEIGIPPVFARKLTFPEPVTPHNVQYLRQLVINGDAYPGASMVESEDGSQQFLDKLSAEQRVGIANQLLTPQDGRTAERLQQGPSTKTKTLNKKVYRHLMDGDVLILNRQPTLHKPSMMAHKARVLRGEKTIRMHYANCNSYNADFDGDEMNIHFPQNHVARAEAELIANTNNQYLVPTSGKPLRGLIQDHVVAGVWMTNKNTFFSREQYFQLLYGAIRPEDVQTDGLSSRLKTLPPAIWKPRPLWTGKQIISTILLNLTPSDARGLNLTSKAKVPGDLWGSDSLEGSVVFVDGELMCGILDKAQFGATEFGLVHSVYELYGADNAGLLLGMLSRLFTKFLQTRAFTCRMDDLTLTAAGNKRRVEIMADNQNLASVAAHENFPALESIEEAERPAALERFLREILRDENKMAGLDMVVKTKLRGLTKSIADNTLPKGLLRKFPDNNMQTMTISGAKGSAVNVQQISCALGQQELEGRRVPVMVSGKTLPSFQPFETSAIAGGYIASRFLTGVRPQEFYFHCMAGREGLIDTAVKTSRSGYLQRCLIKHLEGLRAQYDNTVRGHDGSIYQFFYGGDGLDVTKQKHLLQFEFSARNDTSIHNKTKPYALHGLVDDDQAASHMRKTLKRIAKEKKTIPAPAMSIYNPSRFFGSTSEKFADALDKYIRSNPHGILKSKSDNESQIRRRHPLLQASRFRVLMNALYMKCLVDPGEAVGLLASQGVGEPSTQMTLNTFHFAGHGAANVTLGIPRLREIVMTASKTPQTPTMTIPARRDQAIQELEAFCKTASRLTLGQLVNNIRVVESLEDAAEELRRKRYVVTINLFPVKEYTEEYNITPSRVRQALETLFARNLKIQLTDELKKLDADFKVQKEGLGKGKAIRNFGDDAVDGDDGPVPSGRDDASDAGDGDADESKRQRQKKEMASYADDEPDETAAYDDAGIEAAFADEESTHEEEDGEADPTAAEPPNDAENDFFKTLPSATDFSFTNDRCKFQLEFGSNFPKVLLVGILERVCAQTVVREIPGITDCFILKGETEKKQATPRVMTNGSNFRGLWRTGGDLLQLDELYSNDIYAVLKTYGVEMARATIVQEISNVFSAYKIEVDPRHLELIADYMTFDGGYSPFNRRGIDANSSPLLQASFETTVEFLSEATLMGDFDDIKSPSATLVVGKPSRVGTGAFDIVTSVEP
ncbi:beta and beta-prime subunits of DNA dependent RNA-polymerase [Sistotremastrum niveocremeum HHB9708]|uniref:DNA-directed RNA polymerase subunit n=1 Tax=Sistotremastrum niveocremeum HHB9708 TaxID=1314777 RepID=A0A164ZNC4_9AGAM|nr:beta and beta-prime subunits of DNA dependent RNA-polymerase [Sistotremastrum niveocremeum HHB9708]